MHFICAVDDIDEGESKRFDIGEQSLFVVKKDGAVYTYHNYCPHLGVELEWQEDQFLDPDGALIQCSTHGALFLIESGDCISGPCAGDKLQAANTIQDAGSLYLVDCPAPSNTALPEQTP